MASIKKQMKRLQKQQRKLNDFIRLEQATCPHIKKNGKSRLEKFQDGDVLKGRCKKCGEVVILDPELLTNEMLQSAAEVIKTALAEVRSANHVGKIKLSDDTVEMIAKFDAEVLRELPGTMTEIAKAGSKKKKKKGKKKDKKKNKRERWR